MQMDLVRQFMFEYHMKMQLLSIQLNLNAMYLPCNPLSFENFHFRITKLKWYLCVINWAEYLLIPSKDKHQSTFETKQFSIKLEVS